MRREAERKLTYRAWTGDTNALRRIVSTIDVAVAEPIAHEMDEIAAVERRTVEGLSASTEPDESETTGLADELERKVADEIAQRKRNFAAEEFERQRGYAADTAERERKRLLDATALTVKAELLHEDGTSALVTNSADDLLKNCDLRTIGALTISRQTGGKYDSPRITLEFRRQPKYSYQRAVEFAVVGDDLAWVRSTFASVRDELARDVPWWQFLRNSVWAYCILSVLYLIPFIVAAIRFNPAILFLGAWVMWIDITTLFLLKRYLLIPFELLEPGQKSTASSRGFVVATAIGLLVSIGSLATGLA